MGATPAQLSACSFRAVKGGGAVFNLHRVGPQAPVGALALLPRWVTPCNTTGPQLFKCLQ